MVKKVNKKEVRIKKHMRERNRFSGTPECPRLTVFRSDKHIYAQLIDDEKKVTLCQASTLDKNANLTHTNDEEAAKYRGQAWKITFVEPQRAVAPGQSAVLYKDGVIVGGGVIYRTV